MSLQTQPATGTETVTVACKIPMGMLCRVHEKRTINEVTLGGSRSVEQYFATDHGFVVHGPAHAQNEGPRHLTVAGYAFTKGVQKDLWDAWYEQNFELHAVQANMIFAYADADQAKDGAREHRGIKTGLERLNPHDLPNLDPRFKLETAENSPVQIGKVEADEE